MNLLFDLDGTLTDPARGITTCIARALRDAGVEVPPAAVLESFIGPPLLETFGALLGDAERARAALESYRAHYSGEGMFDCRVHEGIEASLERLGTRHRLFVVTSKPTVYALRIVEHFDLAGYFADVYGSELDGTRAEKQALIGHVLRRESLAAADTVMIGDRRHDVEGARGNAACSIGVLWGFGSRDELVAAGADRLCEAPSSLVDVVASGVR